MAITLTSAAAKAMCDALVDLIDAGAGTEGNIAGYTSGDVEVFTCAATVKGTGAFGNATTDSPAVATANTISDDTTPTGGNLTGGYHRWNDADGNEVFRGSVSTSGADLNISNLVVATTDTVSVSAYTVSQPTS